MPPIKTGFPRTRKRFSLRWTYPILRQSIAIFLAWALILVDLPGALVGLAGSHGGNHSNDSTLRSIDHDLFSGLGLPSALAASPVIYSISPDNVPAGQTVSISGANLGNAPGTVTVAGVSAHISSWGAYSISFIVPAAIKTGADSVVVTTSGGPSVSTTLHVVFAPLITSISPTVGVPTTQVTVNGSGFGTVSGGTVTFNSVAGQIVSWADSKIVVKTPDGAAGAGPVVVSWQGANSNGIVFNYVPSLFYLSQSTVARTYGSFAVVGENFLTSAGTVTLNGAPLSIYSWSNNSISLPVPQNNCTGPVVVKTVYGSSNPVTLTILGSTPGCINTNQPPMANAGANQTVTAGATVQLDGSGSTDPNGLSLSYQWSILSKPAGSSATLSSTTVVKPTFIADKVGNYTIRLIVSDQYANSSASTVLISTQPVPPVANAGPNQTIPSGTTVQLNGSASTDANGYPLTYLWSFVSVPAGSSATLSNPAIVNPTFITDKVGSYVVQLVVNDGYANSAPSQVTISDVYTPPTANAGPNQSVEVQTNVQLDGSHSTDLQGYPLTYSWTILTAPTGSTAMLSDQHAVNPTFTVDRLGNFVIQLIVNDGTANSAPATVTISTSDVPPVANPGNPQTVNVGTLVTLDGTASTDSDGQPLSYTWSLLSSPTGSTAALVSPNAPKPSFLADLPGDYVVQLVVNDGFLNSTPATTTVSTNDVPPIANPGPNQTVTAGTTVQLDGTGSTESVNHPLAYTWALLSQPTGGTAALSSTTVATPTFVAALAGTYVVQLIVNDGYVSSQPNTMTVTATPAPQPPVVSAGPNQTIELPTTTATLQGSVTSARPGSSPTSLWTPVSGPGTVTFANPTLPVTTATFPSVGTYVLQLTGTDGALSASANTTVTVAPVNQPPVVTAGPDQAIAFPLNSATLAGSATDDGYPVGSSFVILWSKVSGPGNVTFANPVQPITTASFSLPGNYVLRLSASDGQYTSSATLRVAFLAPAGGGISVNAGPDQVLVFPNSATLAGTAADSNPPLGSSIVLAWSLVSGPGTATFSSPSSAATTVSFNLPGVYDLRLTATNGIYTASSDAKIYEGNLQCTSSNKGTDFWLMFIGAYVGDTNTTPPRELEFFISSDVATNGTVSVPGQGLNLPFTTTPGQITTVVVPQSAQVTSSDTIETKGIHVTAQNPVAVYGFNYVPYATDGYLALPTNILGTSYVVAAYENSAANGYVANGTEFGVTATQDNTTVTIVPSSSAASRQSGVPFTLQLNQGQTYQLRNSSNTTLPTNYSNNEVVDFTGTLVTSDKPVAVFGGHDCTFIPATALYCNSLVEQIPSTDLWGSNFVTMPLASELNGDLFRFVAQADATQVQVNHQVVATLNKGQVFEQVISGPAEISANNPILAVQYALSSTAGGTSNVDPTMIVVPPFEQFSGSYTINTPTSNFPYNYVNVIAPTQAAQSGGVILDGTPIPASAFQPIGTSPFSGAQIPASVGPHTLTSGLPFGLWVYGFYVTDAYGYTGGVCLSKGVTGGNLAASPKISTNQVTSQATIQATVTDSAGQPVGGTGVTFTVAGINPQSGFAITDATGTAVFAYSSLKTGSDLITVTSGTASDIAGVTWVSNGPNQPPVVSAGSNQAINLPANSVYLNGSVVDDGLPVGGTLTSTWTQLSGPAAATFGTPNQPQTSVTLPQAGSYVFQLTGNDSQLTASASVTVVVSPPNQPPVVNAGPSQTLLWTPNISQSVTLMGSATDDGFPTGSTLAVVWKALSGTGATFSSPSSPVTQVTFAAPGTYALQLSASDGQFISMSTTTVIVYGPVIITPSTPTTVIAGSTVQLNSSVTVGGQLVAPPLVLQWANSNTVPAQVTFATPNSPDTSATFPSVPGTYDLTLTVSDPQAGPNDYVSQNIRIIAISANTPVPTVALDTALDGTQIKVPTPVTGSVSSGNWTLDYALKDDFNPMTFTAFATGTAAVTNGVLGTFDPTLLLNGTYVLRLTSVNAGGQAAAITETVNVAGNMKVGVFSLAFNDLTVPVAGIPIQVVRSYDSRDKGQGDFGTGWRLSLANIHLQKSKNLGLNWQETQTFSGYFPQYCLFAMDNKVVTVTFPDGRVFTFQTGGNQQCQIFQEFTTGNLSFTELPGPANTAGATLATTDSGYVIDGSVPGAVSLVGLDGNTYNPTLFILKTADGTSYTLDQRLGLIAVTDTNGNTLTLSSAGITSSSGKSVPFVRDDSGRITTITDFNGNTLKYGYDSNGNLVATRDRTGNNTVYAYNNNHGLLSITTPDGKQALTNSFDPSGRLTGSRDGNGFTVSFSNNVAAQTQTITDRNGNPTSYAYDADGNITQVTDALGHVTTSTYDANDNKLSESNALGKTTNYTYDANGNRLMETDPLQHTTTYTYNALNKPLTIKDPNGNTTTNTYDANGNLLTTQDPLGNTTTNTYSPNGLLATTKDPLGNITSFSYDGPGNLLTQTDAKGTVTTYTYDGNNNRTSQAVTRTLAGGAQQTLTTSYAYDGNGKLVQTTYPDTSTSKTVYNTLGQQVTSIDALNRQTAYQYDLDGHLTLTTYPDTSSTSVQYDPNGNRIYLQDRGGPQTYYTYDALNRLTQTQQGASASTATINSTTYDAIGQVLSSKDPNGNVTQYAYDDAGRRTTVTDALNHVTSFVYDASGNQTSVRDANNNTTTYVYDAANRRTQVLYAGNHSESTAYDALGRVTSRTDAKGLTTQYGYDALGRLTSVTDALSQVTQYTYDEVGNRITQTDANTHTTSYAYDQRGRRISRTLPMGQTESYTYDAAGNMLTRTDFNGKTTTYAYDAGNRLLSKTPDASFNAAAVRYTYDNGGRRTSMIDASGWSYFQNDPLWGVSNIHRLTGYDLGYTFDKAGNVLQIAGPVTVNYTYDALNRLATVWESTSGTTSYTYDNVGNLQSVMYPNGVVHNCSYDTRNRLSNLGVNGKVNGAPGPIASYAYTLDASGHRTAVTELSGRTVNYGYDNLYRLTNETIAGDTHGMNGVASYVYDAVGNRTQKTSTLPGYPGGLSNYNANDQLAADTYDANGNTTASTGKGYVYDFENHLIQAGGVTCVYDGDGNRVQKVAAGATTQYTVDSRNPTGYAQVLVEWKSGVGSKYYIYGLELLDQWSYVGGVPTASWYVHDGHGSVRALTDSTGAVTDTYDYDAFGNLLNSTFTGSAATPNNYLFADEQFDPDLNLYYNRARYLNASTGRFWSMDDYEGDPQSPASLHKYLYAGSDPINRVDHDGHDFSVLGITFTMGVGTTIFGMSAVSSYAVIGAVTGGLFAASFSGIGAALEGQTPEQIEATTGNPYNIALGALMGAAGSYATAFRLGRAVLVLASLGGGGSASYNAYKQGHIAAAVYYGALALGGAFLSAQSKCIALKGPIPDVAPTSLSEQLILEEAAANADQIMVGVKLADAPRLEAVYGDGEWVKMEWIHQEAGAPRGVAGQSGKYVVHFFKNIDTGQTVEFKFKGR